MQTKTTMSLIRVSRSERGAFGVLTGCGLRPALVTLEATYGPKWTTKIPVGSHKMVRGRYDKGGYDTWEILVPGHDELLFHVGNYRRDTDGCVLVGAKFAGEMIITSRVAFRQFMKATAQAKTILLEVEDATHDTSLTDAVSRQVG